VTVKAASSLNVVILYLQGIKPRERGSVSGLYNVVKQLMRSASHKCDGKLFYFKLVQYDAFPRYSASSNPHMAVSYFPASNAIFISLW